MAYRSAFLLAVALVTAGCICHCSAAQQVIDIATVVEAVKPQVAQAKSSGSPISIQLQEAFYNATVPLHLDVFNNVHLNIPVTITGQGPDKTVLDCGFAWRAISILGAGAVSVSNLTIQNCASNRASGDPSGPNDYGPALDSHGGAVFLQMSEAAHDMAFRNCKFIGNRSPSTYRSSGSGGALYVGPVRQSLPSARLLIDNCSFENNTAPAGGAVSLEGYIVSVSITNTTFQGNKAETVGGCVYLWRTSGIKGDSQGRPVLPPDQPRATHNVSGCTFRNNYAGIEGGGIAAYTESITFTDTLFEGNMAGNVTGGNSTLGAGGALCLRPFTTEGANGFVPSNIVSIVRCSFVSYTAIQGPAPVKGAGVVMYVTRNTTAAITDSHFKGNNGSRASAMQVVAASEPRLNLLEPRPVAYLTIINTSFQNNTEADECAGGFAIVNEQPPGNFSVLVSLNVTNSTFGNATQPTCVQPQPPPQPKPPSWLEELQPQVLQSINSGAPLTVQLNATTYNMTYPLVIDLSQSQFKNISVTITGQGPNQTILDCQGVGRAVLILGAGSVSISNLTIQNCDTTRSLPGYPPMPTPVYDGASGAAVYLEVTEAATEVSFTNCRFFGNTVVQGRDPCFESCTVPRGGAVYIKQSYSRYPLARFLITNCTFVNNTGTHGGAVFGPSNARSTSITNSVFQGNKAIWEKGGGLYMDLRCDSCVINVTQSRFLNNYAAVSGGGLFGFAENFTLIDSIFEGNSAGWDETSGPTNRATTKAATKAADSGAPPRPIPRPDPAAPPDPTTPPSPPTNPPSPTGPKVVLGNGAGLHISGLQRFLITVCSFLRNTANERAAGARTNQGGPGATLFIGKTVFEGNDAPQASALQVDMYVGSGGRSNVTLSGVVATNNTGTDCKGGININRGVSVTVTNTTLDGSGSQTCLSGPAPPPSPVPAKPPAARRSLFQSIFTTHQRSQVHTGTQEQVSQRRAVVRPELRTARKYRRQVLRR